MSNASSGGGSGRPNGQPLLQLQRSAAEMRRLDAVGCRARDPGVAAGAAGFIVEDDVEVGTRRRGGDRCRSPVAGSVSTDAASTCCCARTAEPPRQSHARRLRRPPRWRQEPGTGGDADDQRAGPAHTSERPTADSGPANAASRAVCGPNRAGDVVDGRNARREPGAAVPGSTSPRVHGLDQPVVVQRRALRVQSLRQLAGRAERADGKRCRTPARAADCDQLLPDRRRAAQDFGMDRRGHRQQLRRRQASEKNCSW